MCQFLPKPSKLSHKIHKASKFHEAKANLKTGQKILKILELIKALGFKHAVLIKYIIHEKVYKCDLGEKNQ